MFRIYGQFKLIRQELDADDLSCSSGNLVRKPQHKIISVADIAERLQTMQYELVKFIQEDIRKNLAGQITDGQTMN